MNNNRPSKKRAAEISEVRFPARSVSRGIAIGKVICLHGSKRQFYKIDLDPDLVDRELDRFRIAVRRATSQLRKLSASHISNSNDAAAGIFDVQLMILEGSSLIANIETAIRDQKVNAEWAVQVVSENYLTRQKSAADKHLREKYLDVEDVSERLLAALAGTGLLRRKPEPGCIIVAREVWPSTLIEIAASKPKAVITEHGGWTSHTSILARGLNLPAVTGITNVLRRLSNGDHVIVDGFGGQVILNPSKQTVVRFEAIKDTDSVADDSIYEMHGTAKLLDGREIVIRGNIDKPEDYAQAERFGAQGIGLYRSEFLFNQSRGFPSESKQIKAYGRLGDLAGGGGVKIRTFDVGRDELTDAIGSRERNPSLGLRSIRLSLLNTKGFRTQIRALLQAAHDRRIDIVLPMVSGVEEILRSRRIIYEERSVLLEKGIPIGDPGLGAMIEVPSAVLMVSEILRHVDFLCLGTNDLVQYLLAVDRDNEAVADWYQTLHPAVIKAIKDVLQAAEKVGIPAVVCGEIAGSPFYTPLLIGLGAREFSMNVKSIPQVRRMISGIAFDEAQQLVKKIASFETAGEIELSLRDHHRENWSHLFPPGILDPD